MTAQPQTTTTETKPYAEQRIENRLSQVRLMMRDFRPERRGCDAYRRLLVREAEFVRDLAVAK